MPCTLLSRLCRALLAASLLALPAAAQGQAEVFTLRSESHLVNTAFLVHDREGALVHGLDASSFTLLEDGIPQTVRFFARDAQLPLSVGLLLDRSGSQDRFAKEHERDIQQFLAEVLEPQDQAFAVCFGNHLRLVSDFTSSAAAIADGIHHYGKSDRDFPELAPDDSRDLGTALYDAVYFSTEEKLKARAGTRKVLLLLSDGEENSSEHDLLDAIAAAQSADVVVFAIRYTENKPAKFTARDRYGIRVLDHLAQQTGGRAFDIRTTELKRAFAEIAGELRATYEIAYQSTQRQRDGLFRKVEIRPVREDLIVRARPGYYAR